jgi:hypothetical protein
MSSINGTGSYQRVDLQTTKSPKDPAVRPQTPDVNASPSQSSTPVDTNETQGAKDAATAALVQQDLTNDQARSLSADIGKQLGGQGLSIANRAPQALAAAFSG